MKIPGTLISSKYYKSLRQYKAVFTISKRYNQLCQAIVYINKDYYFQDGHELLIKNAKSGKYLQEQIETDFKS